MQSTMAGQGFSWTLQVYLLMLLVHPLDHSSRPERDMGTSGLLPEELELQDMDPEAAPWVDLALVSWTCLLVELLIMGIVLGCYVGRRLWRRRREVREGGRTGQIPKLMGLLGSPLAKAPRRRGAEPPGRNGAQG